jgi:hypothetical protein
LKRAILLLGLGILLTSQVFAQYSGQFSTAITTPTGASRLSAYAGIYDGALGILGQYRYGIGAYTDIGFKAGVIDFDRPVNNAGIDLAGDFKYLVMERRLRDPFDLSIGGEIELIGVRGYHILSAGINAIGSYPVQLHNGRALVPYGRLNLRVQRDHYGRRFGLGETNTDLEIGLNLGTSFELSKGTRAFGEFQFDDPFAFFIGFDFDI